MIAFLIASLFGYVLLNYELLDGIGPWVDESIKASDVFVFLYVLIFLRACWQARALARARAQVYYDRTVLPAIVEYKRVYGNTNRGREFLSHFRAASSPRYASLRPNPASLRMDMAQGDFQDIPSDLNNMVIVGGVKLLWNFAVSISELFTSDQTKQERSIARMVVRCKERESWFWIGVVYLIVFFSVVGSSV